MQSSRLQNLLFPALGELSARGRQNICGFLFTVTSSLNASAGTTDGVLIPWASCSWAVVSNFKTFWISFCVLLRSDCEQSQKQIGKCKWCGISSKNCCDLNKDLHGSPGEFTDSSKINSVRLSVMVSFPEKQMERLYHVSLSAVSCP